MRRWVVVDVGLVVVVVVLGALVALTLRAGPVPGSRTEQREATGPVAAAGAEVLAFLQVDHDDMAAVTARVLDGATGGFEQEYAAGRDRLVARVEQREATVEASLRAVGVVEQSSSTAVVLVAADTRLVDRASGDEAVVQRDRLRVGLARVDGRWKVDELEYVR